MPLRLKVYSNVRLWIYRTRGPYFCLRSFFLPIVHPHERNSLTGCHFVDHFHLPAELKLGLTGTDKMNASRRNGTLFLLPADPFFVRSTCARHGAIREHKSTPGSTSSRNSGANPVDTTAAKSGPRTSASINDRRQAAWAGTRSWSAVGSSSQVGNQ